MSMSERESTFGSAQIAEAHRRLEQIKETHKKRMFEDVPDDAVGVLTQSRDRLIADVCEEVQEVFPEPEPYEVKRYRALVLSMDTMRNRADLSQELGDPLRAMQNVAIRFRETALGAIENRLVLETPTDDEDAEVVYIVDPVSKVRHTTALGGYKKEYDEAMIEDQKKRIAEQILNDPIPNSVPRV